MRAGFSYNLTEKSINPMGHMAFKRFRNQWVPIFHFSFCLKISPLGNVIFVHAAFDETL